MVKSKKQTSKKGNDTVSTTAKGEDIASSKPKEVENTTEDINNEESENASQENGIEDASTKNGEEKSDKKKPLAKAKKTTTKKEPKPQVEPARKSSRTPKPVTKEGDSEVSYEVEKIVDFRLSYGVPQYLVRWKGYSRGDDTWEDERDLNCPDLLQKFKSENPDSGKKAKKRPSKSPAKTPAAKKTKKVEKDYEVEKIVGLRIKNGKKEFKIRWKGYKESDDSWEPEKHLSCADLIDSYLKEHGDEIKDEEKKTPAKKAVKKTKTPAKSSKTKKANKK